MGMVRWLTFAWMVGVAAGLHTAAGESAPEPIRFGLLLPVTGPRAPKGTAAHIGIKTKLAEINAAGGLLGRPVEILPPRDYAGDEALLMERFDELAARPDVVAIIGPLGSDRALTLRDRAREKRIPLVSPDASLTDFVQPGGWVFSATPENTLQARAMAEYLYNDRGLRRVAVVVDLRHPYADELARAFLGQWARLEGEIVTITSPEDPGDAAPDYRRGLAAAVAMKPDAIYASLDSEHVAPFFRQLATLPYDGLVAGGDSWDWSTTFGASGNRIVGSVFSGGFTADASDERLQALIRRFYAAGATQIVSTMACAHDACSLLEAAIRKGGATREGIRAGWLAIGEWPLVMGEHARVDELGRVIHDTQLHEIVVDDRAGSRPRFIKTVPAPPPAAPTPSGAESGETPDA